MVVQEQDEAASIAEEEMENHPEADMSFTVPRSLEQLPTRRRGHPQDEQLPLPEMILPDCPITFEQIAGGATGRGDILLADSYGFTYSKKRETNACITWVCSKKRLQCRATVKQVGEDYTLGTQDHNHPSNPEKVATAKARALVKEAAMTDFVKGAGKLAEEALDLLNKDEPLPDVCRDSLARAANRARATLRPKHPADLAFQLDMGHIPNGFLRRDIQLEGRRHLIFATDHQLTVLSDALTWYMDGTFKTARDPFKQLFTIHSFIHSGDSMKQVPLCYVMMSRRKTEDYTAVFNAVRDMLPRSPRVEEAVLDFEQAVWSALPEVFPGIEIFGCWFHWAQTVYRKIARLGLRRAYMKQPAVRQYLKELMALPNLPAEHIATAFEELRRRRPVNTRSEDIEELLEYLEDTWVKNAAHPPSAWSTFQRTVRTNNDVEGWHKRINLQVKDKPNLYLLVGILHKESSLLPLQVRLLHQRAIGRLTSKQDSSKQAKLEKLWASYGEMTTSRYLRQCAGLSDHSEAVRQCAG
ncbi:uncharacterized protein LOC134448133 [Engraulis encrasicolus]|uniref:uncharacterized protein LOC134448133 n=1 Tax=Engraulis encrasicolus TaxID=184585 RepID=UPI002FD3FD68